MPAMLWYLGCSVVTAVIIRKLIELWWTRVDEKFSMNGKTVVITGASSGIGLETTKTLAKLGAKVIMACRDMVKCDKIIDNLTESTKIKRDQLVPMMVDLSSLESVRHLSSSLLDMGKIDYLILNAGVYMPENIMNGKLIIEKTNDDLEVHMGVNHLSHFLIVNILLPKLKKDCTRIICIASGLHKYAELDVEDLNYNRELHKSNKMNILYNNSKLANVLFARELAEKLDHCGSDCCSLCPGLVYTDIGRYALPKLSIWKKLLFLPVMFTVMKTPHQGIQTILFCIKEKTIVNGGYYNNCKLEITHPHNQHEQKLLWKKSCELVSL